MNTIPSEKALIRLQIKKMKANISSQDKAKNSLSVLNNLEKDNDFINSKCLIAYWSMNDELNTHSFVEKWHSKKKIYLPVVIGDILEFRLFEGRSKMKKEDSFGIYEPIGEILKDWNLVDYAIIPGVAFDRRNNRLGRGKGFYDKILNGINAVKVGVCFEFQCLDKIPIETTDIPMDRVYC